MRSPYTQQKFTLQALTLWACATFLVACGGGGGGGGGGAPVTSAATGASAVSLAWDDASGPVAGYSVLVERDASGIFHHEADVPSAAVTLNGDPGQQARIVVIPFDSGGTRGPGSLASDPFQFPDDDPDAMAAAVASMPTPPPPATVAAPVAAPAAQEPSTEATDGGLLQATDLVGRLVWEGGDAMRVTDASLDTLLLFARPTPDHNLVALSDFDGDGVGDLLWANGDGEVAFTPASALAEDPSETPLVSLGTLDAGQTVAGADDFDGDGLGDVLLTSTDGNASLWLTDAGGAVETVAAGTVGDATLAGTGDFDGNGTADVAWRSSAGALVFWLMDSGAPNGSFTIELEAGFDVASTGDFDGNGTAEVAVRDASGAVSILYPLATPVAVEGTDVVGADGLAPAGASDIDGDGTQDLVWVSNSEVRTAYLPGQDLAPLDPESPWQLVALIP
ncbi:MAG: VCBS repeat-containing protein [Myxococcota bacterium]